MAREYPDRPVVGVGGVVVQDGRALIVKRAHEPRKGEWSLPGGLVELGETLAEAARREIKEETGLDVEVSEVLEVFDRVHRLEGRVRYHFVIVDYLCRPMDGTLQAGDDAEAVAWVTADEIASYGVNEFATRVILRGLERAALRVDRTSR
jgi:ADP-ribose pyrophosphatase YjhB (NUDIX family)